VNKISQLVYAIW